MGTEMFEKNGVAILTPEEYRRLKSFVKPKFQRWLDLLLFTGMRYTEALKFIRKLLNELGKHLEEEEEKVYSQEMDQEEFM